MNTASVSNQAALSQMLAAQQASASAAISSDTSDDDAFEGAVSGASPGAACTGLTGSTTGTLDSQTLQALLGLTQTDPPNGGTSQTQAQGTQAPPHHHHRHHGGGMSPSTGSPGSASTPNSASADGQPDNGDASENLTAGAG